jgi:hypothetical protein
VTFLHTELLDSLKQHVLKRMETHRDRMANGLPELEYREVVGRHRECKDLLSAIDEVAKEGNEDDDDQSSGATRRR